MQPLIKIEKNILGTKIYPKVLQNAVKKDIPVHNKAFISNNHFLLYLSAKYP